MWCAECGDPLKPMSPSGWARCCRGRGYWSSAAPLPADAMLCRQFGVQIIRHDDLFLFPGPKWIRGAKPEQPRQR